MRVFGFIFVTLIVATPGLGPPSASAQSPGDSVMFIVPAGTPVQSGDANDVAIFTTRPLGLIGAVGACEFPGDYPLQNVVFVHPAHGANTATVIVLSVGSTVLSPAPVRAGTRLEQISGISSCSGPDGSAYEKWVGTVR